MTRPPRQGPLQPACSVQSSYSTSLWTVSATCPLCGSKDAFVSLPHSMPAYWRQGMCHKPLNLANASLQPPGGAATLPAALGAALGPLLAVEVERICPGFRHFAVDHHLLDAVEARQVEHCRQ